MTRDEFMEHVQDELTEMVVTTRKKLTNLMQRAWAEGKKHAEVNEVAEILREALQSVEPLHAPHPAEPYTPVHLSASLSSSDDDLCPYFDAVTIFSNDTPDHVEFRCDADPEFGICRCRGLHSKCERPYNSGEEASNG